MKRMKTSVLMSLFLVAALLLAACSSATGGTDAMAGTWELSSAEASGITLSKEALSSMGLSDGLTMEFNGGKFTANFAGETGEGTYKIEGDKVTMTSQGEDLVGTLVDNELHIEESGATLIFTKK